MQTKRTIIIAITILLAVAALFFLYLIYQEKQFNNQQNKKIKISEEQKPIVKKIPENLKGKIYLTLKEKTSGKQGIYYFDLDKNKLLEVYISDDECEMIGGRLNSDGTKIAYASNCGQEDRDYQIFTYDLKQKTSKQITDISGKIKKEMAWSKDDSEIVFVNSNSEKELLGEWSIYKTDLVGNENFVASNSWNPFFLENNNEILAFREDGFHLYDTKNNQGKKLLDFSLNSQFDFSDKSNDFLFSLKNSSGKNKIEKYKTESWNNFKIRRIEEMEIPGNSIVSWLRFNSKNEKYATGKRDGLGESLAIYDLENNQEYLVKDFSENYYLIQIDDWR
jgi:predicted NUDIX family NTP pyrophosphohydrolase